MRRLGLLALTLLVLGCRGSCWGLPRVALEETSPDGAYRAQVRNHFSIDPPSQSLWIAGGGRGARKVLQLAEDQDWCDAVTWSADSSTVAFLVQDAWIAAFDAATGALRLREQLAEADAYPTTHEVRDLELDAAGTTARYRLCRRGSEECSASKALPIPPPPT